MSLTKFTSRPWKKWASTVNQIAQALAYDFILPRPLMLLWPIIIDKPHPDPLLTPVVQQQIGQGLRHHYGWEGHIFLGGGQPFSQADAADGATQHEEAQPGPRLTRSEEAMHRCLGPKEYPGEAPLLTQWENPSKKTAMEEVEEEEAAGAPAAGKKKRKPRKRGGKNKKKPAATAGAPEEADDVFTASPKAAQTKPRLDQSSFGASVSTLNIPVVDPSAGQGQSAHSYLKELNQPKEKFNSRGDYAYIFSNSSAETKKGGIKAVSSLYGKGKEDQGSMNAKNIWFSRLSKKATESMHQLLKASEEVGKPPSPMRWETFLKLMREMGFDPSTVGSSVRFDPPNPSHRPITIHKPHPDPTLTPLMLRQIGKRLNGYYGWNAEDFVRQTQERAGK
ncbi:hypothetical protein BKA70DRAFT_1421115 [Coprinopsis sp. MPI-PUGE-AT-0042]|nr:hypothetical protein BKA70DRAFT_1421115 [Coprinopsis sp. MPI-PUGE-AT-0042]